MSTRKEFDAAPKRNPAPLAEEVRRMLAATPTREPIWRGTPAAAREAQAKSAATRAPGPALATVSDDIIGTSGGALPIRLYRPNAAAPALIVYFHGGGWVIGSIDDSDAHVRRMVEATGCTVVSVGYRLAPENPFPAAIDDALAAWRWVLESGLVVNGIIAGVAGDSAGGNIAAGACIALRDAGATMPSFQILGYPITSAAMESGSYVDQADGPILTAADMRWFWDQYAPDPVARSDPRASPLAAESLAGLPPARIMTAACDPLRDEGEAYAARLAAAGVDVQCQRYDGMVHGFYKMADVLAGGREALAGTAEFIRARARS